MTSICSSSSLTVNIWAFFLKLYQQSVCRSGILHKMVLINTRFTRFTKRNGKEPVCESSSSPQATFCKRPASIERFEPLLHWFTQDFCIAASFIIKDYNWSYWTAGTPLVFLPKTSKHHPWCVQRRIPWEEAQLEEVVERADKFHTMVQRFFLKNIVDCGSQNVTFVTWQNCILWWWERL